MDLLVPTDLGDVLDVHVAMSMRMLISYLHLAKNYVVCQAILNRKNLPTLGNRHETRVQCEHCGVYLCIASTWDCFKKYHTQLDYLTGPLSMSLNIIIPPHFFHFFSPQCVCTTVVLYLCVFVSPCTV